MSLLGNYSFHTKNAGRLYSGSAVAGASASKTFGNFEKNGAFINFALQDGLETLTDTPYPLIGFPWGYSGRGWKLPIAIGAISGQLLTITFDGTANGAEGKPGEGSVTFTISATGSGGLVVAGEGAATIEITSSAEIAGYIQGEGSSTITITAEGDTLLAIGWMTGESTIMVDGSADPLGWGIMEGTTDWVTTLTAQAIANAVWDALQADINNPGTAGAALLAAGSAGDPWASLLSGYTDDATFGAWVKKLLSVGKFIALK
jgi:hypothetical protein